MHKTDENYNNLIRLYVKAAIGQDEALQLDAHHVHYVRNVMRKSVGDNLRIFNGSHGEWLYKIKTLEKRMALLFPVQEIRPQPEERHKRVLVFAPLKKTQTDFVLQKATELGVTDIYPVQTDYTNSGQIKLEKWHANIIEAAEQCERLDIPVLHNITKLKDVLEERIQGVKIFVALEREKNKNIINNVGYDFALIVGPEGGFSDKEKEYLLQHSAISLLNLGDNILRAETAVVAGLAVLSFEAYKA